MRPTKRCPMTLGGCRHSAPRWVGGHRRQRTWYRHACRPSGQEGQKAGNGYQRFTFFDSPNAAILADGHPRRTISVVAALSEWLIHTNRRLNGSWTQRYEHGIPVTDLTPIPDDCTIGTVVHFLPSRALVSNSHISASKLRRLAASFRPLLPVEIYDEGD